MTPPDSSSDDAGESLAGAAPLQRARLDRALAIACYVVIAFLLFQILTFGYGRDQGIYAMVARAVVAGQMPYRDAWDFKPPGIFLVYAVSRAILGLGQTGIRFVEVAGLVAMIAAMMRLTGDWWGDRRIGLLAGAIAVLVHAQLDFWHTAQPESFGGMVTIFALDAPRPGHGLHRRGPRRGSLDDAPAGGRGRALRLRRAAQAAAGGRRRRRRGGARPAHPPASGASRGASFRAALRPAALVLLGGATPFVLCLGWFASRGALRNLYDVLFVFTPHYTRLSWVGETASGMVYTGFTEWLTIYSSVATAGVLLCLAFPRAPRERFGVVVLGAIIAVHIVGVSMQAKFFPYHWGATWPLTALLAALGFHRVWERLAPRGPLGVAGFFALIVFTSLGRTATKDLDKPFTQRCAERLAIFTHSPRDQGALDRLASVADVNAVANREVAAFLRARVPADRRVFVWGFEPVIYDLADRTPATRYLYDVPQRVAWAKERERQVLMEDLGDRAPGGHRGRAPRRLPRGHGRRHRLGRHAARLPRAHRAHRRALRAGDHDRGLRRVSGATLGVWHAPCNAHGPSPHMRIALLSTPFIRVPPDGYGGTELFCYELAEELHARRHEVTLFTTGDSSGSCPRRWLYPRPEWPPSPYDDINHVAWAFAEIARGDFDVIHLNSAVGLPFGRHVATPVVYTLHHHRIEAMSRLYAKHPRVTYVAISGRQLELEVTLADATVIHHGLAPDRYPPSARDEGYLLHLGRYAPEKGTHLAIDAARVAGLPLVLAGRVHAQDAAYFADEVAPRLAQPGASEAGRGRARAQGGAPPRGAGGAAAAAVGGAVRARRRRGDALRHAGARLPARLVPGDRRRGGDRLPRARRRRGGARPAGGRSRPTSIAPRAHAAPASASRSAR